MERVERVIETDMGVLTEADFEAAEWGDSVNGEGYLRPKFDSVAAFKLHGWSMEGTHNEEHGNACDWHRWSALFRNVTDSDSPNRSEQPAAILTADPQGFISAEWYADGNAAESVWESLEREWEDFDRQCEGHYDTDDALTSGAGIGEPSFCDGACRDE